jgi:hypothetical protein
VLPLRAESIRRLHRLFIVIATELRIHGDPNAAALDEERSLMRNAYTRSLIRPDAKIQLLANDVCSLHTSYSK